MIRKTLLTTAFTLTLAATPALAAEPSSPASKGQLLLDFRARIETVDDAAIVEQAQANTVRLRLGYRTASTQGWSGVFDVEGTTNVFGEDFNSTANGRTAYPMVVDPDNAELNQAYVQYAPLAATRFQLGRQRLIYDNQRFFGNSGWRQNEQTFDALNFEHRFGEGLNVRYSYLDRVVRINGNDNPNRNAARWQLDGHVLSVSHALGPGTLTGYAHFIDNQTLPLTSHRNLGLRYAAKHDNPDGVGWLASAEYAQQDAYADGMASIDADYTLLEGGPVWRANTFKAGWERLGGDGTYGFATPFATLHAFNGWADRFLTTPVAGLRDSYLGWNRKWGSVATVVSWHDFQSDHGDVHFGQEWDASLTWAFAPHWNALLKYADYRADDIGFDVRKAWLSVEYTH